MLCDARRITLYPVGSNPYQNPSCILRGQKGGSKGDGIHLGNGRFQPRSLTITRPTLELESVRVPFVSFRRSSFRLQNGAFGDQAVLEIAPERDQQLACDGDDRDAPDTALGASNPLAEPDAQRTIGLET